MAVHARQLAVKPRVRLWVALRERRLWELDRAMLGVGMGSESTGLQQTIKLGAVLPKRTREQQRRETLVIWT